MTSCFNPSDDTCFWNLKASLAQRLCQSDRDSRIHNLMLPTQSQRHLFVSPLVCLECDYEAAMVRYAFDLCLVLNDAWLNVTLDRPPENDIEGLWGLRSNDRSHARANNSGLLG